MRAIIIEDKDARALLERLELAKFTTERTHPFGLQNILEEHKVPRNRVDLALEEVHRAFHYVVCSWLQEQGAKVVR